MALPNTISIVVDAPSGPAQSYLGPFKSSGGNYYGIFRSGILFVAAFKATDPESTWTEQDASNQPSTDGGGAPGALHAIWCYQRADLISIIFGDGFGKVYYGRFNMAADAWVDLGASDFEILIDDGNASGVSYQTIVVASDGDIYVGYTGDIQKFMGVNKERVYWDKSDDGGVTWNGPTHLRTTNTVDDLTNVVAVLGASDRIHYFWARGIEEGRHRSLSSGDSLDTEATFDANMENLLTPNIGRGDVYTDGSNQIIRVPYKDFNDQVSVVQLISGASPTLNTETNASDNDVETDRGVCACIASRNGTDKESWLAYVHDTDRDLYVDVNIDGAGWGTDTEVHNNVDHAHVSCNVITNEAGDLVLGMIIQDEDINDDPVRYTEHFIAVAAPAVRRMAVIGG